MEEGLFLHRIALNPRHVSEWNAQLPIVIEPHLANAALAFADHTAMTTRQTADTVALGVPQFGGPCRGMLIQYLGERLVGESRFHTWLRLRRFAMELQGETIRIKHLGRLCNG